MPLNTAEQQYLQALREKINRLREHLVSQPVPESTAGMAEWYAYLNIMKEIQGNASNAMSFIGCLMAKEYLDAHLPMRAWSVAEKPQSAPGLDIDERTVDGKRVIGELKTTMPYKGLGAQQAVKFQEDFVKLNKADADYKFFFVTEEAAFQVTRYKFSHLFPGVKIVLLTTGEEYQAR